MNVWMLLLAVALPLAGAPFDQAPAPPSASELAAYRLTMPVFARFERASRLIAAATRQDPRFADEPLFSKAVTVEGDAAEMAAALQRRLEATPVLAGALFAADIDAREYATFAITLFGARLAHGFVESGAMRRVPPGVAADNVAFVEAHERAIAALLRELGLEG